MPRSKSDGRGAIANGRFITARAMNEIEDIILRHEGVERCCVVSHGTLKAGRHLHALILAKGGVPADEKMMKELKHNVEQGDFEDYEVPTKWRAVRWLPEAPKRETLRMWLKQRTSFSKLYYPGRQAPLRGEKDWENPKLSIFLTDPLNSFQFEGAITFFKVGQMYGERIVYFDLSHKIKREGVVHPGGNRFRSKVARFYAKEPAIMRRAENSERGAHLVVRAQAKCLRAGGSLTGNLQTAFEVVDLEVRSDFVRTGLDDTDKVFERAL